MGPHITLTNSSSNNYNLRDCLVDHSNLQYRLTINNGQFAVNKNIINVKVVQMQCVKQCDPKREYLYFYIYFMTLHFVLVY